MATTYPSQKADKFLLRLPDGVRQKVYEAAVANNRTMTKEMALRLQQSFEDQAKLPVPVQEAIRDEMAERGGTEEEALLRLVLAGQANGGTIFYATISPQTTIKQLTGMLESCKQIIPPDASIIIERKSTQN